MQEVSRAVCRDGHAPPATRALGKLGASGKFQGNVERDLHRYCFNNDVSCGITTYDVDTMVYDADGTEVPGCLPILLPHEVLWSFYNMDQEEFKSRVLGSCDLDTFWSRSLEAGLVDGHPCKTRVAEDPGSYLPLRLHGDDAPMTKSSGLLVMQITSLLCRLPSMLSKILVLAIPMVLIIPEVTMLPLYRALVWSFEILLGGTMPHSDHTGKPFSCNKKATRYRFNAAGQRVCGRFHALLMQVLGDWKFLKEEFKLTKHYNGVEFCYKCRGVKRGRGPKAYHYSDYPEWLDHLRTATELMQGMPSILCNLPGFTFARIMCDLMHIVLLGILQWATGGCLWEAVYVWDLWPHPAEPGGWKHNVNKRLALAFVDFKNWCRQNGVSCSQTRFRTTTLAMDKLASAPLFKGKAANTLKVSCWLAGVVGRHSERHPFDQHITHCSAMLWGYCFIFDTCLRGGLWFDRDEACRISYARQVALGSNAALSREALQLGKTIYPQKPKHHLCDHALRDAATTRLNPGHHWTFSDEDFIGRMVKLSRRCHASTMPFRVVQRYLCAVHAQFAQKDGQNALSQSSTSVDLICPRFELR